MVHCVNEYDGLLSHKRNSASSCSAAVNCASAAQHSSPGYAVGSAPFKYGMHGPHNLSYGVVVIIVDATLEATTASVQRRNKSDDMSYK